MVKSDKLWLHRLLVLSEKPAEWSFWWLFPAGVALAAGIGWLGSRLGSEPGVGLATGLILVACLAADWMLLAALPRLALSFGAVQPPWLGLVVARSAAMLVALAFVDQRPVMALGAAAAFQALLWGLMAYGTLFEAQRVETTRLEIPAAKLANPGASLRLVQISDLHVERLTRRERALPELVAGLRPDVIVLTGDFLNTSYNDDPEALADLEALVRQLQAPLGVYGVWGTQEVDLPEVLRPVLARAGVRVLEDEAVAVGSGRHPLWLMGISATRDLEGAGATLRRLVGEAPPGSPTVLLFHTPDLMPQAAALGVDLVLSGHTHGGQWRLPGFGAILTSSVFWKRYEAGHYHEGGTHLYVSRGLGMEGFGAPRARFFCRPEVVAVTLSGARVEA